MNLIDIQKHIHKINKVKLLNNDFTIIDTKEKYIEYANIFNIPTNIVVKNNNWVLFLRPDYEIFIKTFYKIYEIKNIKISSVKNYEELCIIDKKLPPIEYLNNGIYNN